MLHRPVLFLSLGLLTSCTMMQQGPPAPLEEIAQPAPLPGTKVEAAVPVVVPAGPAGQPTNRWRAWVPRQVQPNGDIEEGHWLDLSFEPPAVEVLEPPRPIPRAPKPGMTSRPAQGSGATQAPLPPGQSSMSSGQAVPDVQQMQSYSRGVQDSLRGQRQQSPPGIVGGQ